MPFNRGWLRPLWMLPLAGLVALAGCSGPKAPQSVNAGVEAASTAVPASDPFAGFEIVDLSYAYGPDTLYWPTSPSAFELEQLAFGTTDGGFFYSANRVCTPEHGGTHLDAPIHFGEGRQAVDAVPLERLIGRAVVLDVSSQAAADPDYRLSREDVLAFEAEHGPVPPDAIVLLRTGWGARWPDRLAYFGDDTPNDASNLHFPSYGADAAEYLVSDRRVAVLGVDTASIDHGPSTDFPVHRIAAAAEVPGLENVARLDRLPATGAWILALPMKIAGGSGAPVRIAALVPAAQER